MPTAPHNRRGLSLFDDAQAKGLEQAAASELKSALWDRRCLSPTPPEPPKRRVLPERFVKSMMGMQKLDRIRVAQELRIAQLTLTVSTWWHNMERYILKLQILSRASFSHLRSHAKQRREAVAAALASSHWVVSTEASALLHMLESVDRERRESYTMMKATGWGLLRIMKSTLGLWRQHTVHSGLSERVNLSAAVMVAGRNIRAALQHWRKNARFNGKARLSTKFSIERFRIRWLAGSMLLWLHHADEQRHTADVMRRVIYRVLSRQLSRAFRQWRDQATEERWIVFQMRQALIQLVLSKAAKALRSWIEVARERSHNKAVVFQVSQRLRNLKAAYSFSQWRSVSEELLLRCQLLKHAVMRFVNTKLCAAFFSWHQVCTDMFRQRSSVRKAMLRLVNSKLYASLVLWRQTASDFGPHRELCRKAILRMISGNLARSLLTWRLQAAYAAEACYKGKTVILRIINRKVYGCLKRWRVSSGKSKHHEGRVRWVLMKMTKSKLSCAFCGWRAAAAARQNSRQAIRKALLKLFHSQVACAWCKWIEFSEEIANSRSCARRAALMFLQRAIGTAFRTWRGRVSEMRREMKAARKAIMRMRAAPLTRAWVTWRTFCEEAARTRKHLRRALMKMIHSKLSEAFSTWNSVIQEGQIEMGAREKAIMRWWNGAIAQCLGHWRELASRMRWVQEAVSRFGFNKGIKMLRCAFRGWLRQAGAKADALETTVRVITKTIKHLRLLRWREWTSGTVQIVELTRAVLRRCVKRELRKCMHTWMEHTAEVTKGARLMRKAMAARIEKMFWEAFLAWYKYAADKIALEAIKKRKARSMAGEQIQAMVASRKQEEQNVRIQAKLAEGEHRAAQIWIQVQQRRAFGTWLATSLEIRKNQQAMERALKKMRQLKYGGAFMTWFLSVMSTFEQQATGIRAANFLRRRMYIACWEKLRGFAKYLRQRSERLVPDEATNHE